MGRSSGGSRCGAFWARRARRLLPALFALVAAIGVYYALAGPTKAIPGLQGDGISTLLYFSNWHQIAAGTNYFAASGPVSPLQHTWSLAIEEQFYVLWPLLVLGVLALARRRGASRAPLACRCCSGSAWPAPSLASVEMALLFDAGRGLDRVYYGTDTRATGLLARRLAGDRPGHPPPLAGHAGPPRLAPPWARHALGAAGLFMLPLLAAGIVLADGDDAWVYPFGMLATDAAMRRPHRGRRAPRPGRRARA